MADPTEEELRAEEQAADAELAREAERSFLQKIWDALGDHNERHPYQLKAVGLGLLIAAAVAAVRACGHG